MSSTEIINNGIEVAIVMATYNGELYIQEQLDSIRNQTHVNWILLVRDDFSSDSTSAILDKVSRIDGRIRIIKDSNGRRGACQNFSDLMSLSLSSNYLMFCDQDDIWLPNKIKNSIAAVKLLETKHGADECLLVYGTYELIDQDGMLLKDRSPDYSTTPDLKLVISQSYLYGCTMLINNKLLRLAAPIPLTAENHDYWISLVALANKAKFFYVSEPLLNYRQHSNNVSGSYKNSHLSQRIKRFFSKTECQYLIRRMVMLESLLDRFSKTMHPSDLYLISGYIKSISFGGWRAVLFSFKNGIKRRAWKQTILFYLNIYRLKNVLRK